MLNFGPRTDGPLYGRCKNPVRDSKILHVPHRERDICDLCLIRAAFLLTKPVEPGSFALAIGAYGADINQLRYDNPAEMDIAESELSRIQKAPQPERTQTYP